MERKRQKKDQADAVVHIPLAHDDIEACMAAIKPGLSEAVKEIDRVNTTRKGKRKLRMPMELAFLDAAGNKMFVFPASGSPQFHLDQEIDPANFPNCAYVVATDGHGERIVIRIEYERTIVQ